jgi:hypothetical protein
MKRYWPISKYSLDWGEREPLCKTRQSHYRNLNRTSAKYKSEVLAELQPIFLIEILSIILNFSTWKSSEKTVEFVLIVRHLTLNNNNNNNNMRLEVLPSTVKFSTNICYKSNLVKNANIFKSSFSFSPCLSNNNSPKLIDPSLRH